MTMKINAATRLVASQQAANDHAKAIRSLEITRGTGYSSARLKLTLTHKYGHTPAEADAAIKYVQRLGLTGNPDMEA